LREGSSIAPEATSSWHYFYELAEGMKLDISLAHPLKTRAIAEARIKTGRIDPTTLAHLLRANPLPRASTPARQAGDMRGVLRYRASLVFLRVPVKNKVHAVSSTNGVSPGCSDVISKSGVAWLRQLDLRIFATGQGTHRA